MMQLSFLPSEYVDVQWMTPEWAATALVEHYFSDLGANNFVLEPSCGRGAFLKAIPGQVKAIGVEIDPELADAARSDTGRQIITGDFCNVELPADITDVIGNPPFVVRTITQFLSRSSHLPNVRRVGFLLPAYAMQTHNTVARWLHNWSIRADLIPRRLFPRLRLPLLFVLFERSRSREMIGFALYRECVEFGRLGKQAQEVLINGRPRKGVWRALVDEIMRTLGGEASLDEIYRAIEPRRPTPNAFWKPKVRQILQMYHVPVERGRWRMAEC